MTASLTAIDPCRCPLCGQPNACAMASPQTATPAAPSAATPAAPSDPCWCTLVQFSADLLQQVPEAARRKACICAACVAASDGVSPGEGA